MRFKNTLKALSTLWLKCQIDFLKFEVDQCLWEMIHCVIFLHSVNFQRAEKIVNGTELLNFGNEIIMLLAIQTVLPQRRKLVLFPFLVYSTIGWNLNLELEVQLYDRIRFGFVGNLFTNICVLNVALVYLLFHGNVLRLIYFYFLENRDSNRPSRGQH